MLFVKPMSREQLLAARICCGNKCLHCPYVPKHEAGATRVDKKDSK